MSQEIKRNGQSIGRIGQGKTQSLREKRGYGMTNRDWTKIVTANKDVQRLDSTKDVRIIQ
jgi:hypothetical protein